MSTWQDYVEAIVGEDRQVDIARKAGVDQGTVSRWLVGREGKNGGLSPATARKFARGYKRPVIEAFVAAGLLSPEEAGMKAPTHRPLSRSTLSKMTDTEFVRLFRDVSAEAQRRITRVEIP